MQKQMDLILFSIDDAYRFLSYYAHCDVEKNKNKSTPWNSHS